MDAPVAPAASRPATGATIDLGRPAAPQPEAAKVVPPPAPQPSAAAPRPHPGHAARPTAPAVTWHGGGYHPPHPQSRSGNANWVPFVVLGLAAVFLFKHFWVLGVLMLLCWMGNCAQRQSGGLDRKRSGGSGMVWLIGIPVLIVTGWWWPGLLFLFGIAMIMR